MDINVVMGLSQQATAMASRSPGRADPVGTGGKASSTNVVDRSQLIGMESINRAIKELKAQEPIETPVPVGLAIQALAEEFLDQLPTVNAAMTRS
ncbi:MAG: hypothetical protein HQL70_05320 [Magnetococcales bacterium]|nr:hypothetical protein [Magnetococcales bacterium]